MTVRNRDNLTAEAQEQTGLSDFGDEWIFVNIDVLIPALNKQARLSAAGVFAAENMILSALINRLRHIELIKQNPEILDEKINVAAILTGLPRTGSTMLHRMLAAAPELTGVRWYETQNYVPLPGETRDDPQPRRVAAQAILDYMLAAIPELMSIHPMSIDQADEEVIILGQLFSSSMIESTYYVPDYAAWLSRQDPRPAYEDLIDILKSLQWQDASRAEKSWVLKTPGHLMALGTVLDVFPTAKVVMTHRNPAETVPSYCSMEATLYRLGSDDISNNMIGAYWKKRLNEWLSHFMEIRETAPSARFLDVNYKTLLTEPIDQGLDVLSFAGIPESKEIKNGMEDWIEANKREHRAAHKYTLEDFGLSASDIQNTYRAYIERFIS